MEKRENHYLVLYLPFCYIYQNQVDSSRIQRCSHHTNYIVSYKINAQWPVEPCEFWSWFLWIVSTIMICLAKPSSKLAMFSNFSKNMIRMQNGSTFKSQFRCISFPSIDFQRVVHRTKESNQHYFTNLSNLTVILKRINIKLWKVTLNRFYYESIQRKLDFVKNLILLHNVGVSRGYTDYYQGRGQAIRLTATLINIHEPLI